MSDCQSNCHRRKCVKGRRKSCNGLVTEYLIIIKMKIMNEQTNNTQAIFMEVTSRKVEAHDKKITAIEEKVDNILGNTELFQKLFAAVEKLHSDVKSNSLQPGKIESLS